MKRRPPPPSSTLTSLLDVLFIIVFASLVQQAARGAEAKSVAPATPTVTPPPAPVVGDARARAVSALSAQLARAPTVVARVSADGVLTALELPDHQAAVSVPLVAKVPDRDVGLAYLGDRAAELRVCRVIARELKVDTLDGWLVVIAPATAQHELTVALAGGLRRDAARCQTDQRAIATVVDPLPPPAPPPTTPAPGGTP